MLPPVEAGVVGLVVVEGESPDELVVVEVCDCKSMRSLVTLAGRDGVAGAGVVAVPDASVGAAVEAVAPDAAWAGAAGLWLEGVVVATVAVDAAGVASAAVVAAAPDVAGVAALLGLVVAVPVARVAGAVAAGLAAAGVAAAGALCAASLTGAAGAFTGAAGGVVEGASRFAGEILPSGLAGVTGVAGSCSV